MNPEILKIVAECKKGSREAWQELYQLYSSSMFAVCMRYTNSADSARDILHDGFIKVFTKIDTFRFEGEFEGWMRRIFVTLSLEYIRKNSKITFEDSEQKLDSSQNYDESIFTELSNKEVINEIEKLPVGYKTVIKLYCVDGYSHSEIATMLGISAETSRSQLMRGKRALLNTMNRGGIY